MTELTLGEFCKTLGYLIDNNRRLIDNGDTPISVCLEGEAGLGKTAVVQQVAESKGMSFVKINLAQLEEPAELIGFPYKEYKVLQDGEPQWIPADLLKEVSCDYTLTSESRMSYAVPSWVPREFNPNGTMLVLDDFTRANTLIIQAVMEIISTGSYVSWSLPKYTNIVLTSNPDNSSYTVQSIDSAVVSRMIRFSGKFDINEWARWAEMFGIDGRAINFAVLYSHELFDVKDNVVLANARNYTTFCRAIGGIDNWSTEDSLVTIMNIASGCFFGNENVVGSLFTTFIHGKLDKLISPEKLVTGNWDTVSAELKDCVYNGTEFKADIASLLGMRFMNYCDKYLGTDTLSSDQVEKRLDQLTQSETPLFTQDILYTIMRTLCANHPRQTNKWFLNKNIRNITL